MNQRFKRSAGRLCNPYREIAAIANFPAFDEHNHRILKLKYANASFEPFNDS